jgi:HD-like signal output (HDOD) protein
MFMKFLRKNRKSVEITVDLLNTLYPINSLTPHHKVLLSAKNKVVSFKKGKVITSLNSSDDYQYYLLDGKLKLTAADGKSKVVTAGSSSARHPISNLQPRRYKVTSLTQATILVFNRSVVGDYFDQAKLLLNPNQGSENSVPILSNTPLDTAVQAVLDHFEHDVTSGRFVLPSMPEVASEIIEMLDDPDITVAKVARKASLDPAIAIKLVNCANSPLFKGVREVSSCEEAVVRIGLQSAKDLIRVFAIRDLYTSKSESIQNRLRSHWNVSKQVAAIAYTLAKLNRTINPNEALLAGAVHNIGVVPAILYAEQMPELLERYQLDIDEFVNKTKTSMGVYMLKHWQWPEHLVEVVSHAENWSYQPAIHHVDMTDIIIVANAHLNILRKFLTCPPLREISSFSKLSIIMGLTPEKSIQVLVQARKEIQAITSSIAFP